ncbi:Mu transposase C-terminal domain-containing protein [uncultured Amnibacterium sp.]|uniref:Mu transposase C-terminal domain-containing protein n=1 Tax=uncultured Amnibacterium sp. TaxID=1631851 RepID=UPI0035CB560A
MTVSRPARLVTGDEVGWRGSLFTISAVTEGSVALASVTGEVFAVSVAELLTDPGFTVSRPKRVRLPPRGVLEGLPQEVVARAQWWEAHVVELLHGVRPDSPPGTAPAGEYDPLRRTLRAREAAKVAELEVAGETASLTTVRRMRRRYQADGLLGLVDGRLTREFASGVDERVITAIEKAVADETDRSTGTVTRLRRKVVQILAAEYGIDPGEVMPPRTTFYRLVAQISASRHTFGSAPTRRSLAQRPDGPFGAVTVLRAGEWCPIDSTPLDVRVVLDDGTVDRVELTMLVDIATRTIPAAVLRPTTKAVDASLLLAKSLTPEAMRPGWADALRMSRSVLPHQRMVALDERLRHAAARPVIVPETLICDHGMVYLSQAFRAACRAMGVNFQPTHEGSPWEKGTVERTFASVASMFAQYVAGYVGRSVDRRGTNADQGAVWSMVELQDLLDEWIVAHWQNRPHDGLRHPLTPGAALTPNEQYAALLEVTGFVPVPLTADDYIALLPVTWRVINAYGIKINRRTYDCAALNPYRGQSSGVAVQKGRWEIHYDPYDVTRIWVRNHPDGGWITVAWTHLRNTPMPFGEAAWSQAREILSRRGGDRVTETEIAGAVEALLDKAEHGPDPTPAASPRPKPATTKRDRRVAARTRATAEPAWPRPVAEPDPGPADSDEAGDGDEHDGLAAVIPLAVFDAHEEAKKWW